MSAAPRNFRPSISEGSTLLEACRPRSNPKSKIQNPKSPAFSLIELLVALVLAAALFTVAVMIYQSLTASGSTRPSFGTVTLGSTTYQTFYGLAGTEVSRVFFAPSYGRAAQAEIVRSEFIDDLQSASAVYCLGRNGVNSFRARSISISATFQGSSLDTPEAFRQFLAAAVPATAATFTPYGGSLTIAGTTTRYSGASTATNASIFVLEPSAMPAQATNITPQIFPTLAIRAIYDIDLTPTTSPAGTYVSVKRYGIVATTTSTGLLGAEPTDYYDVFYPTPTDGSAIPFNPLVVCFERATRAAVVEGNTIDRLKKAAERPFYFVWWPDPAAHTLQALSAPSYGATDPRASYAAMGARTAFFFVVPMFPAL